MSSPIIIKGSTLGKKQQELNLAVKNTVDNNIPFDEIEKALEKSDIDRLFKIDVASQYKNINYILETLKCGDSLYISRALKSTWLYNNENSDIINPDYLQHNIFPYMSLKMKKKLLSTIATYVRDEKRCKLFYDYCRTFHFRNIALKFLIFTSSQNKADLIKNDLKTLRSLWQYDIGDLKNFIGHDTTLAESLLEAVSEFDTSETLDKLQYFYSINANKYLDWLEKYWDPKRINRVCFGRRVSTDIVKKHKNRILKNIPLYVTKLNKDILRKKTSVEDAKKYAVALLPNDPNVFWDYEYVGSSGFYYRILEVIPLGERFIFIKSIFNEKYPNAEFEMSTEFYKKELFKFMTASERESWALSHLKNETSVLKYDDNYQWYKFINFQGAFEEIKKYVFKTPDAQKRANMLKILVESAKSQADIEKLLTHYYQRHNNEKNYHKESFLMEVMDRHNAFEFNKSCWAAYEKLLCSVDTYRKQLYYNQNFLQISMLFHLINKIEFPKQVKDFTEAVIIDWYDLELKMNKLNDEQKELVYEYLIQLHEKRIKQKIDENNDAEVEKLVKFVQKLHSYLKKPVEALPTIIIEQIKPNKVKQNLTQSKMIQFLKQDASLVVDKLEDLKETIEKNYCFRFYLNTFFRKLKTYFLETIAVKYLEHFMDLLKGSGDSDEDQLSRSLIFMSVYAIFQLGDENCKTEFILKHFSEVPSTKGKIDYSTIDNRLLQTQEAICRLSCFSRPPVPLTNTLQLLTGDYVKYCLPMFNYYISNLPPAACLKFVESIIDGPVSIQKHGLRMAFKCFDTSNLTILVHNTWKKTRNVSLRKIIYESLTRYLKACNEIAQPEIFKLLLDCTNDLNEDDQVFDILDIPGCVPLNLTSAYLEEVWKVVSSFSEKPKNSEYMVSVLQNILTGTRIIEMDTNFLQTIVNDYLKATFVNKQIIPKSNKDENKELMEEKFKLMTELILVYIATGKEETGREVIDFVMNKCLEMWNEACESDRHNIFYARLYLFRFIEEIVENTYGRFSDSFPCHNPDQYDRFILILEYICQKLQEMLPVHVIYILLWKIRIAIILNLVLDKRRTKPEVGIVLKTYTGKLKELIQEYVSKNMFWRSLLKEIGNLIYISIEMMSLQVQCLQEFDSEGLRIWVGGALVGYKLRETVLLALQILPKYSANCSNESFKTTLKQIESIDDVEIQTVYWQKFIWGGFALPL